MSLLDLSLLGLLSDQPLHGYELSKRLRELGRRGAVSYGALYPALGRLDRKGFISSAHSATVGDAAPMTGSLGAEVARLRQGDAGAPGRSRRRRKVYTITPSGRRRLHELLTEPATDDRTFDAQFAFAGHLEPAERLRLLQDRRRLVQDRLGERPPRLGDRYRLALRERDRLADEGEAAWLDHLIAAETGDAPSPPPVGESAAGIPRTVGGSIR